MAHILQNSFSVGEVSGDVFGQKGTDAYNHALAKARNVRTTIEGGIARREGTLIVDELEPAVTTGLSGRKGRLLEFKHTRDENFIIALLHQEARIYTQAGVELNRFENVPLGRAEKIRFAFNASVADNEGHTYFFHWLGKYFNIQFLVTENTPEKMANKIKAQIVFYDIFKEDEFSVSVVQGQTYPTFDITFSGDKEYKHIPLPVLDFVVEGLDVTVSEVVRGVAQAITPWTQDELDQIDFCQDTNRMIIVHPNHAPAEITYNGVHFKCEYVTLDSTPAFHSQSRQNIPTQQRFSRLPFRQHGWMARQSFA